ncbi:hypothetical protein RJT34_31139 [Clitoria ternatea]|uniref:TraB family protein n=1 Tax=Clitoria ternatea TaxID=43366 RepID=A0AAN9EU43_CLITE
MESVVLSRSTFLTFTQKQKPFSSFIHYLMAHRFTQLARVTRFIHRPQPSFTATIYSLSNFAQFSSQPATVVSNRRPATLPEHLSRNVVALSCESTAQGGVCHVYVVGTCHVSEESSKQVQGIVSLLKPEVVFLELCKSRVSALSNRQLKVPTVEEIVEVVKKNGNIFQVLMSWHYAKIASELNVVPGAEFRVAYEEAIKYGGKVILGDRLVQITFRRTWRKWRKIPLWHKAKSFYSLFSLEDSELPDILEKTLGSDYLEKTISSGKLIKTLMAIDDSYMAHYIQEMIPSITRDKPLPKRYMSSELLKVASKSSLVVAVVGKGHLPGIKKNWKRSVMMEDLMTIPPKPAISAFGIFASAGAVVTIVLGVYLLCK